MLIASWSRSLRTSLPRAAVAATWSNGRWAGRAVGRRARWKHYVALQLGGSDRGESPPSPSPSPGLAGVACAPANGPYDCAGLEVSIPPPPRPPGPVPRRVRELADDEARARAAPSGETSSTVLIGRADRRSLVRAAGTLRSNAGGLGDANGLNVTQIRWSHSAAGGGGAIRMEDYTYRLDPDSIARYPAEPRGTSRLVRVDGDGAVAFHDDFSRCFPDLSRGAHLVLNDSRVVNARLRVSPAGGGEDAGGRRQLELMILDIGGGGATAARCNGMSLKVMLRMDGVRPGDVFVEATSGSARFRVLTVDGIWEEDEESSDGNGTECTVRCIVEDEDKTLDDLLAKVGTVPIPPYLHRESEPGDAEAYQNVYAADDGASVAAPTAGLHFTDEVLDGIGHENISYLSLHVGAGTFKPVTATDARDHNMHAERFSANVGELRRVISALEGGKRLVVVGTTSTRTLESLYWCGVRRYRNMQSSRPSRDGDDREFFLGQHEWAQLSSFGDAGHISAVESLRLVVAGKGDDDFISGCTSLMIVPRAYEFRVVDELVTNFHAPDSTLMLLVSAFLGSGDKVREVYHSAQRRGYKFLSYGDVCLFSRPRRK